MFLPQPEVQISIKCQKYTTYTPINSCSRTCAWTCTHRLMTVAFYYSPVVFFFFFLSVQGFFIIFLSKLKYVHLIRKLIIVRNK